MLENIRRVWLARHAVDFRCGHEGLMAQASSVGLDIISGEGLLFIARDKKKLKLLFADENGLWVAYKKFSEKGLKLRLDFFENPEKSRLSKKQLLMLFSGASYEVGESPAPWP